MSTHVLISATELADVTERPVLLDVRFKLGDPAGALHYSAGHVPGAVYVDLDAELAAPPSPEQGRHPLPDLADLQENARRWGIRQGEAVVVYDDWSGMGAARAWWLLRWAGIADVRLLDGGIGGWIAAGLPLQTEDVKPGAGDVVLTAGNMPILDADAAAALARDGVLFDARAGERYRGEVEPLDPRAGHIPGAHSMPTTGNIDETGHFLPADRLRRRFAAAAGAPVGVYCGSGVTAAHEVLALAAAGIDAALYPGSWSQWSNDPARPVATG